MPEATPIVNGALGADYTLVIAFSVIGVLLIAIASMVARHYISTLTKIETAIEKLNDRLGIVEDRQIVYGLKNDKWDKLMTENLELQSEMLSKIRSITP